MCQIQERYSGDILAHLDSGVQEQELGEIFAIFPLLPPNSLEAASCIRDVLTYFPSFTVISLNSRRWGEGARSCPGVQELTPHDDTEHGWLLTPRSLTHRVSAGPGDRGHLLWHIGCDNWNYDKVNSHPRGSDAELNWSFFISNEFPSMSNSKRETFKESWRFAFEDSQNHPMF